MGTVVWTNPPLDLHSRTGQERVGTQVIRRHLRTLRTSAGCLMPSLVAATAEFPSSLCFKQLLIPTQPHLCPKTLDLTELVPMAPYSTGIPALPHPACATEQQQAQSEGNKQFQSQICLLNDLNYFISPHIHRSIQSVPVSPKRDFHTHCPWEKNSSAFSQPDRLPGERLVLPWVTQTKKNSEISLGICFQNPLKGLE